MECIETKIVKARKEHCCEWCNEAIVKGARYQNFTGKDDTGVYHFKSHLICQFVADQLTSKYAVYPDGMDGYDYYDAVTNFFEEFIASKKVEVKTFPEKITIVADVLKEYEFVEELKKPNKPYSRFWNPVKRYLKKRETPLTID